MQTIRDIINNIFSVRGYNQTKLAKKLKYSSPNVVTMTLRRGNPEWNTIALWADKMDYKIVLMPKDEKAKKDWFAADAVIIDGQRKDREERIVFFGDEDV